MRNQKNNSPKTKYSLLSIGILGIIIFMIIGTSSNTSSISADNNVLKENTVLAYEEISLEDVHNILPVFEDIVTNKETTDELTVSNAEAVIQPSEMPVEKTVEIEPAVEVVQEVSEPVVEVAAYNGPSYDMINYYANNFYQLANDYPDWYWMSKIIMAESEGESEEGQIAVGNVILNRVNSHLYKNTVKDVIHERGQFSVFANGRINLYPTKKCITSAYKVLYENAKVEGMTDQVLYFRSDRASWWKGVSYWKTIGNHHFAKQNS